MLLRVIGLILLPFSCLFILSSWLGAVLSKVPDTGRSLLIFGVVLFVISAYLMYGAPHLIRALERRQ